MKIFISFFMWMILLGFQNGLAAGWPSEHKGLVTMSFDLGRYPEDQEVRLWIPYPMSDRYQLIDEVKIQTNADQHAIYSDQANSNPMLYARWAPAAGSRKLTISFRVVRKERLDKDVHEAQGCWSQKEWAPYLKGSSLAPVNEKIRELARKITRGKESNLAKARAIYDWICTNMRRAPGKRGCGKGDVCLLLGMTHPAGNCADIHSVFVALLRGAGVPAREVFGLRLGKQGRTDITKWQHCWAEFYVPGYGWVAADPGDYLKTALLTKGASKEELDRYRKYFFGGIDQFRVRLGTGRDIILNPPQAAGPLNYFMYPYAEAGNRPLDWLAPEAFRYSIVHQSLD